MDFKAATIGVQLNCGGGQFTSQSEELPALNANSVKVADSVVLNEGFKAEGGVNLASATLGVQLNCTGGHFIGRSDEKLALEEKSALIANGVKVAAGVFLNKGFRAEGAVDLAFATIGGTLFCSGGQFIKQKEDLVLNANNVNVDGNVFWVEGQAPEGEVCFANASVGGSFEWRGLKSPEKAVLDLGFAKVARLFISQDSWPTKGNLRVDGLLYDEIDSQASPTAEIQLDWLHRQSPDQFFSQPYEQLGAVLRERGLEEDARKVMIAKNEEHRRHLHAPIWDRRRPWDWISSIFEWAWYKGLGRVIGYGYHPGNAFVISLIVICIGWVFFERGYHSNLITATGDKAYVVEKDGTRLLSKGNPRVSEEYPKFNAFMYSVETFVPLLKVGIAEKWIPNANSGAALNACIPGLTGIPRTKLGSLLRYYIWFHIIAGWVLTTLWVGGLTGLAKT